MDIEKIREKIRLGQYSISDHAIIEARKDGLSPKTIKKLEYVALNGKVIEDYPKRNRYLVYAEIPEENIPVHVVIDYSFYEEPAIVTAYIPDSREWINFQIRKKR
ncbi:MAG: DUF4258 domain-containing protein [Nitrospirota bacterium]